jgi:hypothetical protein
MVQSYDAATGILGVRFAVSGIPVAEIGDRLVSAVFGEQNVRLDTVDPLGLVQQGPVIESVDVLASGGTRLVYRSENGLHVFDFTTSTDRLITAREIFTVALSPNGENLAWIYGQQGQPVGGVRAMRLDGATIEDLGRDADRVLVADDGTVVFTNGTEVRRGRADRSGSSPTTGLAPDADAILGLG